MTYLRRRDERILGARYLSLEGASGTRWWCAMTERRKLTKFVSGNITAEAATVGVPGQIVFSGLGADTSTVVRNPSEASTYLTGTLALVFTRVSGAAAIVSGVSAIGVTHNDDTGGTVSPVKQGDSTIFSAFTASFGAPVDTMNIDTAAITAVKGNVFPLTVLCYAYGSNSTPSDPSAPGALSMTLAATYRSVPANVAKTISSIAPCSGVRATNAGTLIATITIEADGSYALT